MKYSQLTIIVNNTWKKMSAQKAVFKKDFFVIFGPHVTCVCFLK